MTTPFRSKPDGVGVHDSGWCQLPSGVWVTKLPLWDDEESLFARLSAHAADTWCGSQGWRLASIADYEEIHRVGYHIEPTVLPDAAQLAAAKISPKDGEAIQHFREAWMRRIEWCSKHDIEVFNRLKDWRRDSPVDGAGKHWVPGLIFGWFTVHARSFGVHNNVMIQTASDFHEGERGHTDDNEDGYTDYATLVHAACDTQPIVAEAMALGQIERAS